MAFGGEDDTTQLASPDTRKNAPAVAHVGDLIDIDPHSELIFETPPPDVVDSINECFEQFTSTVEKRRNAAVNQPSSDSDSGENLFITQSRTKAVRTKRRRISSKRPDSVSDDSGSGRENEDTENERGSGHQRAECPKRRKSAIHIPPRRATFPFLLKSLGRQYLSLKNHQILENSEIGGFLKCIRKIEEGCENKGRAISPSMLEPELSDNSEVDDHNSDHEVIKVDRAIFVPSYCKGNDQTWLPQSYLEMRIYDSLSDDNEEQLFNTKGKEKERPTTSTKKKQASASSKKQSKNKDPKSRAVVRTSSESSVDSLFVEQEKQHETHEVLATCSDTEHSDSAHCRHRLAEQTVQSAENLDGDHSVVIEETQRNSIEAVTEAAVYMEHDNASSPSQVDDITGLENTVSDLQSENTTEHVEKMNPPVLSDSLFSSKQKKKEKHKLKEQEEAEFGADTHSADNVHSVEMDQFHLSESQTTEMAPKRSKKKRKERKKIAHIEDNSDTDILSNETSEAPETEQPQHIQTSEEIPGLESVRKKKKKKNVSVESQFESVDFAGDINSVSQLNNVTDRSTNQETVEEAELNDAELSDSVQCAENLLGDHLLVIEDRQRITVEAVTEPAVEHEDELTSDNNLPNKSSSLLSPQGGDISTQNYIQQTDSDFGSEDLFRPLNSPKHKNNQIHKAASITENMDEGDQDSDVTQIESEGEYVSIFGQGTPRWCDGDRLAHEDNDSDETQIETEGKSVSEFRPGSLNKQFTTQYMNGTKHPESQKVGQNPELVSRKEEKMRKNNKKRKTVSGSQKDSGVTNVEENMNVQLSSKHLPPADEPLKEVYSISSERLGLSKPRVTEEMQTDLQETPLFKNVGLSFIKRKGKKKLSPINFIQSDTSVTNEEQREPSVLHLEETSEILDESVSSALADNSVITKVKKKKKKKCKLKEHEDVEPSVENQSVETVQFGELQTAELTSRITKKKKRKDKESSATDIPSNETLDSDRPAELRVNNQSSEVPETNQREHIHTSDDIAGCPTPSITTLKSVKKKKKKKRDETEEPEYESFDLGMSSMSQFDHVEGVVEQQVIEERPNDENTVDHLEGSTPHVLKVAKRKKKGQNASSSSQSDDVIGQASGSQSESTEHMEKKTKKKQKLKERKNTELASDIGDNVQLFQHSESSIDLMSKKTKKKRANKNRERTTDSSSNEILDQVDDRPSEMRGNNATQSIEATKTNHLQTSEEITRCPSPIVTKLSSGKKKKKKGDGSEKYQYESDVNLDSSQLDVVSGVIAQKMTERRPSDGSAVEHLKDNAAHMLKVAKRKKKSQNVSSPSQVDDIIGLENTTELVEKMNSPVLSDSLLTSKQKKKKKRKLNEEEEVESGADTHSADNVLSVEMDQFTESQRTEMAPKRSKKKRKDKEGTKTVHVEDNSGTDILSNETSEAPKTEQPQHIQTSEEITGLKSVRKKKKKKNGSESVEEKPSDVEQTEAELNDTKHTKKRKRSSLSVNNGSEFSSSDAQIQETVAPARKKKKKKRNSDVGGELTLESSDHTVPFEKSQSPMLKSLEAITKKSKRKKNKEMNESVNHIPDDSAELETEQTTRTDPIIRHKKADRHANIIISLGDSADIRKKKKKRKKDAENNITEISMAR